MPNGHYDYEIGACFPDETDDGRESSDAGTESGYDFPYMEKPESVPDECWSPTLGIDWNCMNSDTIRRLIEALWDCLNGESD